MSTKPKEYYKEYRKRLTEPYIKDTLKKMGVNKYQMTEQVIKLKRKEILIHRQISSELKRLKTIYKENKDVQSKAV